MRRRSTRQSLALYQQALRECPECPAEVRGAIGACQYCLGNVSKAKQAFARALELNPGCVVASMGMGVIEMVGAGAKSVGEKGTTKPYPTGLFKAFKQDPSHPYSALLMSEYAMGEAMYDEALAFANLARARLPGDDVQAKAQLVSTIGRLHHARGEIDKAIECYRQAIDLDKVGVQVGEAGAGAGVDKQAGFDAGDGHVPAADAGVSGVGGHREVLWSVDPAFQGRGS